MKHIKNNSSYISWIFYAALLGIGLLCFMASQCEAFGVSSYLAIPVFLGIVLACGGVAYLLYLLDHSFLRTVVSNPIACKLLKTIGLMILLTIGLYMRLEAIVHLGLENSYYENALQTFASRQDDVTHGITYLYLQLYWMIFQLLGAYAGTTILLEIIFQFLLAFLLFFFLQRRVGYICGLTVFGFLMCSPEIVARIAMNSAEMLFFVFCLAVCFLICPTGHKKRSGWYFLLSGVLVGALVFFDVSAILLYVLLVFGAVKRNTSVVVGVSAGFFGGLAGTLLCMSIDGALSGVSLGSYLIEWIGGYYLGDMMQISFLPEYYVLAVLLLIGIFGFFFVAKEDHYSILILLMLVLYVKEYTLLSRQVSGPFVLYLLLICLAGVSLQSCFGMEALEVDGGYDAFAEEPELEVWPAEEDEIVVKVPRNHPNVTRKQNQNEWVYGDPGDGRNVKYIENPLPPPKPHVRRTFEYAVPITEETMEYDYSVAENDDFDI